MNKVNLSELYPFLSSVGIQPFHMLDREAVLRCIKTLMELSEATPPPAPPWSMLGAVVSLCEVLRVAPIAAVVDNGHPAAYHEPVRVEGHHVVSGHHRAAVAHSMGMAVPVVDENGNVHRAVPVPGPVAAFVIEDENGNRYVDGDPPTPVPVYCVECGREKRGDTGIALPGNKWGCAEAPCTTRLYQ
jgi:hypothetical protein